MNLRTVDLNLLVVLQGLLEERHVSRAAERMNMSQPAVSRALQRLRELFDDPLLVRTPQGYDLSARAAGLLPKLDQLLEGADRLISGPKFDPSTSTQIVRFYGPDPEISAYLPALFQQMRQAAPHMSLEVRSDPMDHFALLERGEVHFVFTPYEPSANTGQLRSMTVERLEFGIVMSADNPLAKCRLTMKRYLAASHGFVSLTGRGAALMEQDLADKGHLQRGQKLSIPLYLSSFTSIASFCERSDLLFHLPRRFAEEMAQGRNLVVRDELPGLEPRFSHVYLYWHERFHRDPMCVWVREQLKALHSQH